MGFNYSYFNNNVTLKTQQENPIFEPFKKETNLGGGNLILAYDRRNNFFTPFKGWRTQFEGGYFSKALGGDKEFWRFENRTFVYVHIIQNKLFSGYRFNLIAKNGDVPFYMLPFIQLRGVPAARYQGKQAYNLETEWRWQFYKRWSLVGFTGAGFTSNEWTDAQITEAKVTGGAGFRYFLAKDYGLHAGIDIAKGPEVWAWYLTVGSAWGR